jgi:hypothetical protein
MSKDATQKKATPYRDQTPAPYIPTPEEIRSFERLRGQSVMQETLGELGLTPETAARALLQELGATITKGQIVDGRWVYSKPVPNWEVRQKARQDLTRYWGSYKLEEKDGDGSPLVIEIRDSGDKIEKIAAGESETVREREYDA